jgi:hypothetical protein
MHTFFGDPAAFREALEARPPEEGRCWACSLGHCFLITPNAGDDLDCLGFPMVRPTRVSLCPDCTVAYLNSYNARHAEKTGSKEKPDSWTLEKLRRSYLDSRSAGRRSRRP